MRANQVLGRDARTKSPRALGLRLPEVQPYLLSYNTEKGTPGLPGVGAPGGAGKRATAQTTLCLELKCEAAIPVGASWLGVAERGGSNPGNPLCMYVGRPQEFGL